MNELEEIVSSEFDVSSPVLSSISVIGEVAIIIRVAPLFRVKVLILKIEFRWIVKIFRRLRQLVRWTILLSKFTSFI